ncbi:metal-dependent hydrolase [Paenibacillus chungangensis]|uniref:Metal-dependent hydrolase n=1 Tax=Paenibacillus chungangensis TaxID=696535 RepID=A0ABW3HVJ0_9BACL
MRGKTHLAIGAAIGGVASVYYTSGNMAWGESVYYIAVAAFSALSADLDGPSMLTSRITKLSRHIRTWVLWISIIYLAIIGYLYLTAQPVSMTMTGLAFAGLLIGLVMKQGVLRNTMVSLVGGYLIYQGLIADRTWLMGLGAFIVWAPWLKHRGMTHTVWVLPIWGWLGWGMEQDLGMEGLGMTALLGYMSHLAADTLTPSGVKWLYPLYKKPFRLRM